MARAVASSRVGAVALAWWSGGSPVFLVNVIGDQNGLSAAFKNPGALQGTARMIGWGYGVKTGKDWQRRPYNRAMQPKRAWRHWPPCGLMAAASAVFAATLLTACEAKVAAPGLGGWLFGALALLLVAGGGLWIGKLREAALQSTKLREEQRRAAGLQKLLPGAPWQTDATHRLLKLDLGLLPMQARPRDATWHLRPLCDVFEDALDALAPSAAESLSTLMAKHSACAARPVRVIGVPLVLEMAAVPMSDDAGNFIGYLGHVWAPQRAAQSADPADPTQGDDAASLSFTVSHDLRAPIRVVEGFTRILKEDYGHQLDRVANDHLERVLSAAARMNQMIDALLIQARLSTQPLVRQPVNLSQLASYVVDELKRSAPERDIHFEIEPDMQAHGDPTMLRLVIENLLGNACKYTQRCRVAQISFRTQLQDGRRVYAVSDNGAGFDMRSVDRLFGLFQRLHSASDFPGTGVGLASVRRIVRRHGGDIWAEAEPEHGAVFHFTLGA